MFIILAFNIVRSGSSHLASGIMDIDFVNWKNTFLFFPLMMAHHAETKGCIYMFAQYTIPRTSFSDVDQSVNKSTVVNVVKFSYKIFFSFGALKVKMVFFKEKFK